MEISEKKLIEFAENDADSYTQDNLCNIKDCNCIAEFRARLYSDTSSLTLNIFLCRKHKNLFERKKKLTKH